MKSNRLFGISSIRLLIFTWLLLSAACSFDYEQAEIAGTLSEGVPNSIVSSYTYVDIRPEQTSFQIYSAEARMYHKEHRTTLDSVFFQEIDQEGKVVTEGEADSAVIDTQTDNVEINGSIHFASTLYDMFIETDYLYWNNETRTLEGKPDGEVYIEKADGTVISGRGFSVNSPSRKIEFSSEVEGTYVYSDEEKQEE
ncbi:MAG: LPS export ABC transporter periplasmic protein LptC [Spirochaetota bacterium]|nr:LPS export ABC transporter periplasmic protein LptC [Spirochaetota bacterium]